MSEYSPTNNERLIDKINFHLTLHKHDFIQYRYVGGELRNYVFKNVDNVSTLGLISYEVNKILDNALGHIITVEDVITTVQDNKVFIDISVSINNTDDELNTVVVFE